MRRAALSGAVLAALLDGAPAADAQRARWNTRVFARIQTPGLPGDGVRAPERARVRGHVREPDGHSQRSRVFEYDAGGTLLRSWVVPGQDLSKDHGVQVATSDARGRLVLLDRSPARALLLDTVKGRFTQYATFADLAPCLPLQTGPDCSPTWATASRRRITGPGGPTGAST